MAGGKKRLNRQGRAWKGGGERWLILTSRGVERVTVGELRLRGRRTWGSWRWLLEALEVEEEEGVEGGARAEAPSEAGVEAAAEVAAAAAAATEVPAPSSVSCQ